MKSKIVKHFIYEGLGFPVELQQIEMRKVDDEWHPKINVKRVAEATIKSLVTQKERFTGNQIKFIRSYFSMTLREFAKKVVHESHTAVNKWEQCGDQVTHMDINIEKMLRLYIYDKICIKADKQKKGFYRTYQQISDLSISNTPVRNILISIH